MGKQRKARRRSLRPPLSLLDKSIYYAGFLVSLVFAGALYIFIFALISHFCYIYFSHDFIDWHSFIPFYYGGALNQTSVIRMRSPVRIWVTAPKKPEISMISGFLFLFKIAKAR